MRFAFIEKHRDAHSVEKMAEMMEVSRGGYYKWHNRQLCGRKRSDEELIEQIREIQESLRYPYSYGSPRIIEELKQRGVHVGHNRVASLMSKNGLGFRAKKRFRTTTNSKHSLPVAENLLNRDFSASEMNQVWASDISYIATAQGWLFLCVIIDLYSRKVVGWSMSTRMKTDLVVRALIMACMHRRPAAGLIFHSDRGSQYCSAMFRHHVGAYQMLQSMSRKGDPWDNAPLESFFKTLKSELCGDRAFENRERARTAIFEFIEVWYNRERLHSSIGYFTPEEFEQEPVEKSA